MQRPKCHITCCLVHGFFLLFTVSPADVRKDSSTMADIIMHSLHILKQDYHVDLQRQFVNLQTDNTPREFKNNSFARLMGWITAHGSLDLRWYAFLDFWLPPR